VGDLQRATLLLMLHLVLPFAVVRQQVTKPGFPQTDCAAQCLTAPLHCFGNVPAFTAAFARRVAQRTNAPWSAAPVQLHCAAMAVSIAAAA
jgi:hypothetical protein